jgi:hypothetical protein
MAFFEVCMAEKIVKKISVLILLDFQQYKCGQVVELDPEYAKNLIDVGAADDSESAVKNAK